MVRLARAWLPTTIVAHPSGLTDTSTTSGPGRGQLALSLLFVMSLGSVARTHSATGMASGTTPEEPAMLYEQVTHAQIHAADVETSVISPETEHLH